MMHQQTSGASRRQFEWFLLLLIGLSHAYDLRRPLDLPQGFHDEHPSDRQRALRRAYRETDEEGKEGNGDRDRGITRQGGVGGAGAD
ncbi:hypothetical protein GW17_00062274 [Ensete ventricosum]|nr:hypothetical protein GW17_00062274 [Ensete ventricosum]RZR87635.1 hypothetical protein BHM03_00015089 [Ensete ventricosum]